MKFITKLTAGIVGMGLIASAYAQTGSAPAQNPIKFELPKVGSTAAPATPAAPAAPAAKFTQSQIMEVYGMMLAMRAHLVELEFSPEDVDSMARGIKIAVTQEKPAYDINAVVPQVQELLSQKQQVLMGKIRAANIAEGTAFFAKLKDSKSVVTLPSGLGYEVIKAGTGPTAKLGQLVKFHITVSSLSNQVLQSTAGREPAEVLIQDGEMVPGVIEGLQKIPVGGKYKLYVPYQLAFGDQGTQGMPPAASLIFEIEVLEVKDAPKDAAPAAAK